MKCKLENLMQHHRVLACVNSFSLLLLFFFSSNNEWLDQMKDSINGYLKIFVKVRFYNAIYWFFVFIYLFIFYRSTFNLKSIYLLVFTRS